MRIQKERQGGKKREKKRERAKEKKYERKEEGRRKIDSERQIQRDTDVYLCRERKRKL